MPDLWMPGVKRMPSGRTVPLNGNGRRIFTWHTFECPYTWTATAGAQYLIQQGSDPHFVFHPISGEIIQLLPMNTGARTLRGGNYITNRYGSVHAQVEVIGYAKSPFTADLTPQGKAGLKRLLDFLRSWGIPDQWAFDAPPPPYPGGRVRRGSPIRDGHAYHAGWIGNDHSDPGAIANPWDVAGGPARPNTKPKPTPAPPAPEKDWFDMATENDLRKIIREEIANLPAKVWAERVSLTDDDRKALGGSKLTSISAAGMLKTGVRLQARQTTADAVLKEVRE